MLSTKNEGRGLRTENNIGRIPSWDLFYNLCPFMGQGKNKINK